MTVVKFYNINSWAQCYKTLSLRNLRNFVIRLGVCPPGKLFLYSLMSCWQGQEPTLERRTLKVLHMGKLLPYPQTLDLAIRLARNKKSSLLQKSKLQL